MGTEGAYGLKKLATHSHLATTWSTREAPVPHMSSWHRAYLLPVTITCLHRHKHNFRGWQNFGIARITVTSIQSAV